MATETGVISSITANRKSAEIISDVTRAKVQTTDVSKTLALEDGVSYEENAGNATDLDEITKVDVKFKSGGSLTENETKMLQGLVSSLNKRGGGGGVKITIKTKH